MHNKISELVKRPFIRNVFTVGTGALITQIVTIAFSPIITRLYGPEAFGVLGVFTAIISMIIPVASLTYSHAIVLPKQDEDALDFVKLSIYIVTIISLFFLVGFLVFKKQLIDLLNIQKIENYVILIPVTIFFGAIVEILNQWMMRKKQFKKNAQRNILNILIINITKSLVGLKWASGLILIVFAVLTNILNTLFLFFSTKNTLSLKRILIVDNNTDFIKLKKLAKEYKAFPYFKAPQYFLSSFTIGLPVLLLASLFGPVTAGYYSLGYRILKLPGAIIGIAIGNVFYTRIADAANRVENVYNLLIKATIGLAVVGIIPFGLIFAFGPWLFSVVFGQNWVMAGEYARWLSFSSFFVFINTPSFQALPILKMLKFSLHSTIASTILRIAALYIGYSFYKSDLIAVIFYSVISGFYNLYIILYIIYRSKELNKD